MGTLTQKRINETKDGIQAYSKEQKLLLRLIKFTKGLTESKFDELFIDREFKRRLRFHPMTGDSFILGMGQNGDNEWAFHLDLLQHMMAINLIDTKRNEHNEIVYVLPDGGK